MKLVKDLYIKSRNVILSTQGSTRPEEELQEFRKALEDAKREDIRLDEVYTVLYDRGEITLYKGDITQNRNWEEVYINNFRNGKYVGPIDNTDLYSDNLYGLLTYDSPGYIEEEIERVYPGYEPKEDEESHLLTLEEVVDNKGYLKVTMLDDRYLVTDYEEDKLYSWAHAIEDEEEVEDTVELEALDILKDKYVTLVFNRDTAYDYLNNDISWCKYTVKRKPY